MSRGCPGLPNMGGAQGEPKKHQNEPSQSLRGTCDIDGQWTAGCDFGESVVSGVGVGLPNVREPRKHQNEQCSKENL